MQEVILFPGVEDGHEAGRLSDLPHVHTGKEDAAPGEAAPQAIHRTELSYGTAAHRLHLLVPTPLTPGFDLCSGRCFQVWLALFHHAEHHGRWDCPDALPDNDRYAALKSIRTSGLAARWTVDLLAATCGVDPKTAGRAIQELRDLGWVRYSVAKDRDGMFIGIVYVLTTPPTTLTTTATHRYREQIEKKKAKLAEEEARLQRAQPDYRTTEDNEADIPDRLNAKPR